jgi:hypothetical protein
MVTWYARPWPSTVGALRVDADQALADARFGADDRSAGELDRQSLG